ncbi:MAG: hypothetical protein U0132_06345 [Gemmatimonadaceae bacterium]
MQTLPPYAVYPPEFRFRALTLLVSRLALGGPREIALATLMGARFASTPDLSELLPPARRARCAAARAWSSTLTIPAAVKAGLSGVIQATEDGNRAALREAIDALGASADSVLDLPARTELKRLAHDLVPREVTPV